MALKPLPNYFIIEEIKDDNKTASGIYTGEKAQEKPAKGKIIALPAIIYIPKEFIFIKTNTSFMKEVEELFKKGMIVSFKRWATQEIKDTDGKPYQLVAFDDLLAIYE